MGNAIIVYGKSGAGKTYGLKGFSADELCLIQCVKKPLPFKSRFTLTAQITKPSTIVAAFGRGIEKGVKTFCVDDAGYIMTDMFMNGHRNKGGDSSYNLYNDIGDTMYCLMNKIIELPEDVNVFLTMHEQVNDSGESKLRTIGKLLDDKVCLEGMCAIVLHAIIENGQHLFRCQGDDTDIAKSPEGMFAGDTIPNDLKAVDTAIREYYKES